MDNKLFMKWALELKNQEGVDLNEICEVNKKMTKVYVCCDCGMWTEEKLEKCEMCSCECIEELSKEELENGED